MPVLDKVYLEITNICNLQCDFCPPVKRPPGFLSASQFDLILEILRGRVQTLYFHLKGEPLLHPLLGDFLTRAAETDFRVILTTNGTLLERRLADLQGKASLRRLNVSLHALSGLPPGDQARQLAAILKAVHSLAGPVHVSLRLWDAGDTTATAAVLAAIETKFSLASGILSQALSAKNSTMVGPSISLHQAERFEWPRLEDPDRGSSGFCRGLRDQAGILLDGTVVPCCLDAEGIIDLGNIYELGWDEIMQSARACGIYDGFSRRQVVEPLCRNCSYRNRFEADPLTERPVSTR